MDETNRERFRARRRAHRGRLPARRDGRAAHRDPGRQLLADGRGPGHDPRRLLRRGRLRLACSTTRAGRSRPTSRCTTTSTSRSCCRGTARGSSRRPSAARSCSSPRRSRPSRGRSSRGPSRCRRLVPPDPYRDGLMPRVLRCIDHMHANSDLPVSFTDNQGPFNIALNLVGRRDDLLWMYDYPTVVHELMDFCTTVLIDWVRVQKRHAGQALDAGAFPHFVDAAEGPRRRLDHRRRQHDHVARSLPRVRGALQLARLPGVRRRHAPLLRQRDPPARELPRHRRPQRGQQLVHGRLRPGLPGPGGSSRIGSCSRVDDFAPVDIEGYYSRAHRRPEAQGHHHDGLPRRVAGDVDHRTETQHRDPRQVGQDVWRVIHEQLGRRLPASSAMSGARRRAAECARAARATRSTPAPPQEQPMADLTALTAAIEAGDRATAVPRHPGGDRRGRWTRGRSSTR